MRTIATLLCLFSLLLAGCESMPSTMRERFTPVPPKVHAFAGDLRTVYTAAQLAFRRLDFVLTDSSGAPTRLEASSQILTSDPLGDSRQTVMNLHFHETVAGQTEVEAVVTQQIESASAGGQSAVAKREHGFYETFFATLQQVLQDQAKDHH